MGSPHNLTQSTLLSHTNYSNTPLSTNLTHMTLTSNNSSASNVSSSISLTPSTTSRKAHHPPLEAIQTQKAQASVTFRPISSTSSAEIEEGLTPGGSRTGGGLTPYSPYPSQPGPSHQTPPPGQQQRNSVVMMSGSGYMEPVLMTGSTGGASFPFTPSTLVEGSSVPSPFGGYNDMYHGHQQQQQQEGGQIQTIPLSPPRATASSDLQQQRQQHQQLQLRASGSRRQQQGNPGTTASSSNHPRPHSTGSNININYYNKHHTFSTSKQQGSQGMGLTYSSSSDDPRFQNLPNLWQVLHRKTQPPVCLFNFYLYMRDDEKSSEEVDFWLDVTAHEVLWRLYVRATKRRMAMAEREARMERERMEREKAAIMEGAYGYEEEAAGLDIAHSLGSEKGAHRKQPSVPLDMYEPHWSAVNRYLELSSPEGSSIVDPHTSSTNVSSPIATHHHDHLTDRYLDNLAKEVEDPIVYVHNALKSPTPQKQQQQQQQHGQIGGTIPVSRVQHVRLSGAIPASWTHPSELETQYGTESGVSEGTSTGALPPTPAARPTKGALVSAGTGARVQDAEIATAPGELIERVGTDGATATKTTTTTGNTSTGDDAGVGAAQPRRAMTSVIVGVTKEDLQRSAERIYYKYLIPQAEKRVRIPGAVRKRVALLMDSTMMNTTSAERVGPEEGIGGTDGPSTPVLKRKNNLGSPTMSQHQQTLSPSADLLDRKYEKSKGSSVSEPIPHRLPSSKEKQKHKGSSTSLQNQQHQHGPAGISTHQQPDQDLGLMFAEAREIVFEGMESYYFPRFLKARAYGNMVPSHRLLRCVLGLFFLFVGFAIVLTLIFLNVRPRSFRAWALIPMFVGIFLCTTFQFNICPVLVAMGVSETKWMQFAKVKEPYLKKLHRRRGIKVVVVAVLYTICVGLIFGFVPGHRL
ncbi:Bud site selection protein, Revert to axial protein 1 [Mortierella sp. GBA35]|nr:Bud site selection protein, Revert to axial protein 1 [Mortierella sp. GBA35]